MAGIYIHIPFCRQACNYCNFHFSTSLRYKNEFIAALLKEIELTASASSNNAAPIISEPISSIYFGGGTPSLLETEEIKTILEMIRRFYPVLDGAEVTLEANPDDITEEKLILWKASGINRLSIGVQSFFAEDLLWMNRAHNAEQAINGVSLAAKHFDNITLDLIYGIPGLTDEKWKQNVDTAIQLGINHISCYALTVEPKTALQKMIREKKMEDVDPGKQSEQFLLLMDWLSSEGFEHYEISNFAKPGFRSRHNSSYWQAKSYIGLGPSAHSFDGNTRWWNIANNQTYISSINNGIPPTEKEELTPVQRLNEYIMISLRTMEGIDQGKMFEISANLDESDNRKFKNDFSKKAGRFINSGLLVEQENRLILTRAGKLLADGMASDLFADQ